MNKSNFINIGGYPLKAERLQELQTSFSIFNALGAVIGDKSIVSGCEVTGSTVSNGVVYVNGELFEFVGGVQQTTVRIIEENKLQAFKNGDENIVYTRRYVTFASGEGAMNWADFKTINPLQELQRRILPPKTNPQLYCGSVTAIPEGWQLCDGSNGTPDLRKMFIAGYDPRSADYNAIGKKGGAEKVTLTEAQMPKHSHTGSTNVAGSHTHKHGRYFWQGGDSFARGSEAKSEGSGTTAAAGAHSHTFTTNTKGSSQAHENRPPYYVLAYIIYVGN